MTKQVMNGRLAGHESQPHENKTLSFQPGLVRAAMWRHPAL
jgi:hypothetical protein